MLVNVLVIHANGKLAGEFIQDCVTVLPQIGDELELPEDLKSKALQGNVRITSRLFKQDGRIVLMGSSGYAGFSMD